MWIGFIMGGIVTADSCMTNASVFLGSLTKCCLEKRHKSSSGPLTAVTLVRSEPIGRLEAVRLHKFRSDTTWETQPSALHIGSISLHLREWHCPRKTTCQMHHGVLGWASPHHVREWRDLKCCPLCAVIRYRTTKGFAVSDRACGLCCRVSLWLINTLFICLHVRCPEHLLLWGFL